MRKRQLNSSLYPVKFYLIDASDHVSGLPGSNPSVAISKNSGAFAVAVGGVTELGSGWYAWTAVAADRNALGEVAVHIEAVGADPVDFHLEIVPWDPFDVNLGIPRLDANVTSRASATDYTPTRAAKLDNLDVAISTRSVLTAAGVWANASRTLTAATNITSNGSAIPMTLLGYVAADIRAINGDDAVPAQLEKCLDGQGGTFIIDGGVTLADGAIQSATFQANAITSDVLAGSAILELQTGLGTVSNQETILAYVDELETRLSATRAAKLDLLDVTVSSRLAGTAYVAPSNSSVTQIETVLDGITSLADWLRALIRVDAADPVAKAEINLGAGTFDESKHSLMRGASLAELLEADRYIDTTTSPWSMVLTRQGSGGPGAGVELLRQQLFTESGANISNISTFVGRAVAGGGP
jgi:hypothetical protein